MKNYNVVASKSGRGRLREVVVYERFQLQGFYWEKFDVLDRWSLMGGGRTWRLYCICNPSKPNNMQHLISPNIIRSLIRVTGYENKENDHRRHLDVLTNSHNIYRNKCTCKS